MWRKDAVEQGVGANRSDPQALPEYQILDKDTLVVLADIQPKRTRQELVRMIHSFGVKESLDFVVGPTMWGADCPSGLAIAKFTTAEGAREFVRTVHERTANSRHRTQHLQVTEDVLHADGRIESQHPRAMQAGGFGMNEHGGVRRASARMLKNEMLSMGVKAMLEERLLVQSPMTSHCLQPDGNVAPCLSMDLQSPGRVNGLEFVNAVAEQPQVGASGVVQRKVKFCIACGMRKEKPKYVFCPSCGCRFRVDVGSW